VLDGTSNCVLGSFKLAQRQLLEVFKSALNGLVSFLLKVKNEVEVAGARLECLVACAKADDIGVVLEEVVQILELQLVLSR
jgi:hypothetical protein